MSLIERTLGNGVFNFKLGECVCVCVSVCELHVQSSDSAYSSLHRLLAYTTALLPSSISSVNASLWLIENELVSVSPQCLPKAVKEAHTLFDAGQTSHSSLMYAEECSSLSRSVARSLW